MVLNADLVLDQEVEEEEEDGEVEVEVVAVEAVVEVEDSLKVVEEEVGVEGRPREGGAEEEAVETKEVEGGILRVEEDILRVEEVEVVGEVEDVEVEVLAAAALLVVGVEEEGQVGEVEGEYPTPRKAIVLFH